MSYIKLYPKELILIKFRNEEERNNAILRYKSRYDNLKYKLEIRSFENLKNKYLKYYLEVAYYSDDTLEVMKNDKKN